MWRTKGRKDPILVAAEFGACSKCRTCKSSVCSSRELTFDQSRMAILRAQICRVQTMEMDIAKIGQRIDIFKSGYIEGVMSRCYVETSFGDFMILRTQIFRIQAEDTFLQTR